MKNFRTNFTFKVLTVYLALNIVFPLAGLQTGIYQSFALTGGPAQPEFNSFTPIGTSDMVDLASGDFNYNIPIMDVGGYPLNLSYNSGITMDQESSWVGLGWNLNVGQINRNVRGLPDDFDGDVMIYENNMKKNITVGTTFDIDTQLFGSEFVSLNAGLTVQHNNYAGVSFKPSLGFAFDLSDNVSIGMNLQSSSYEGVNISPSVSIHSYNEKTKKSGEKFNSSIGVTYNSRQGLSSFNLSSSAGVSHTWKGSKGKDVFKGGTRVGGSSSISFVNNTFTPSKRTAYINNNFSFSMSLGLGYAFLNLEGGITGFGSVQEIKNKHAEEKGYGYLNTHHATKNDVLDFNRENDNIVSPNTKVLPVTNYTYDIYSIQAQGIGGMFRPFRSQVGYVYDKYVEDEGQGGSAAVEFEGGPGYLHFGLNAEYSPSETSTGVWNTAATSYFKEQTQNEVDYENVYFKTVGELTVDKEYSKLNGIKSKIGNENPISLKISPTSAVTGKRAINTYREKIGIGNNITDYTNIQINNKILRTERELRNTAIQKITAAEVETSFATNNAYIRNENAENHHIAAFKVLKSDGSTYIYGETAYNTKKVEATFAVNGSGSCQDGLVTYNNSDFTTGNGSGKDNFFSSTETPSFAHTYLLSSIVSSDYEDINNNGPDDKDLGSYTKFNYTNYYSGDNKYNWRVPYKDASYNAGLYSLLQDNKGSVIYGEKELKYINTIETKTHIAVFDLSPRKDGLGVIKLDEHNVHGGKDVTKKMYKINTIKLYSKPEYLANPSTAIPIKTAHFVYNYSLSPHILNNSNSSSNNLDNELDYLENGNLVDANKNHGKLTLKKVYFTYANSDMGRYTPYTFNYDGLNPEYGLKDYNIWGNYKPNTDGCDYSNEPSNSEFPFVEQNDRTEQDEYASAWSLTSIDLPSGGKIELTYEADDYQYVQDRKAMKMFKIAGVTRGINDVPSAAHINTANLVNLYTPGSNYDHEAKCLIVQIDNEIDDYGEFVEKYIGTDFEIEKPVYFRALLNMASEYDFVEGYFNIDKDTLLSKLDNNDYYFRDNGNTYAAIPMKFSDLEGKDNGPKVVNPISKAGWYFGRQYLNKIVGGGEETSNENLKTIMIAIVNSMESLLTFYEGANKKLRDDLVARKMYKNKSWIRLKTPKNKIGGGVRIKELKMHDNWGQMTGNEGNDLYKQFYGQQYDYNFDDGISSGVATFEPNSSKENPFVEPFYNKAESLVAPRDVSYVEKPFGVSFFPSPQVTYSQVTVKNLERVEYAGDGTTILNQVKTNATGKVVNEFYTSKDFPTIAKYTNIEPGSYYENPHDLVDQISSMILQSLFSVDITANSELTMTQGFTVITNDMNGKTKKQLVYDEFDSEISSVEYLFNESDNGKTLDNELTVIDPNGVISLKTEIGTNFDVINDFRSSKSKSEVYGVNGNVEIQFPAPIPVFVGVMIKPSYVQTNKTLHTATTTKVIHKTGILIKKIAKDLGATVSTENLAWDAVTGQVVLTKTENEYNDAYYSLNYPAHWAYTQMGLATNNIDLVGQISFDGSNCNALHSAADFLIEGDQLFVTGIDPDENEPVSYKLWVAEVNGNQITLMDNKGKIIGGNGITGSNITFTDGDLDFKVIRSGYRNLQSASMASVTTMKNPINGVTSLPIIDGSFNVINASAIEYTDLWAPQCECLGIPNFAFEVTKTRPPELIDSTPEEFATVGFNPYLYNVKGNFKAVKSYAYLTKRNTTDAINVSPRKDGFFNDFNSFYTYSGNAWSRDANSLPHWTFASKVSMYSPYGVELENKDALDRYSSAQYGYNYTLPTAVSSNSKYTDMGFDGFEDYNSNPDCTTTHFSYRKALDNALGNAEIINTQSHTGHNSIKVKGGTRATLEKRIEDCGTSNTNN